MNIKLKPNEVLVKDISLGAVGKKTSSLFLGIDEVQSVYKDNVLRSIDYLFDAGMPKIIIKGEDFALLRKYPTRIRIVGEDGEDLPVTDELDDMPYRGEGSIINLAQRYGISAIGAKSKKEILKMEIRKKILKGLKPISELEYQTAREQKERTFKYKGKFATELRDLRANIDFNAMDETSKQEAMKSLNECAERADNMDVDNFTMAIKNEMQEKIIGFNKLPKKE